MSFVQQFQNVDYGFTQALQPIFPAPIVSNRAPTSADKAQIGSIWVQPVNTSGTAINSAWILTSIIANSATWSDISGGSGFFTTLTVNPGPTNLSTVGNGAVSIGNATNTGAITLTVGSGNMAIVGAGHTVDIANDAAANTLVMGSTTNGATTSIAGGNGTGIGTAAIQVGTAAAGDIQIGLTTETGTLYLGPSTAGMTINMGTGAASANTISVGGTGANVIAVGNTQTAGSVTVGNAMVGGTITLGGAPMTGALTLGQSTAGQTINVGNAVNTGAQIVNVASGASGANSTVNVLTGVATAGAQTFNVLTGLLSTAGAVNIGTGTAAHVVTMGSVTGAASTTIQAGTAGLALNAAGAVSVQTATNSAAGTTVVLNARVGIATYTGQTTASGSTITLTLTNSVIAATSAILLTLNNIGTNDAELTVQQIKPGVGTASIIAKNNGADALNGDIHVAFWVLN